jgi:hypothetical protein
MLPTAPKKHHIKNRIGIITKIFLHTSSLDAGVMNCWANEHEQHNNVRNFIPFKLLTWHACCFPINANVFLIAFAQQGT